MNLAIEATAACRPNRTGIAMYAIRLIEAMLAGPAREHGDTVHLGYRLSRYRQRGDRYLPAGSRPFWIQEPLWPPFAACDVVHGTDGRVPNWTRSARLATVHDLGPLIYEDFSSPRFRQRVRHILRRVTETCHLVLTDSQATRRDFLGHFDYPEERVEVVHLGVDAAFSAATPEAISETLSRHGLEPGYVFYVGEISRRKNSRNLIEAFARCPAAQGLPLVIAGAVSFGGEELLRVIDNLGIGGRVRLLGYVPEGDLAPLYAGAGAFLFPTRYEGFGIPILEAMSCGVPVVAGNRGSSPEVAGGHAVLVEPDDPGLIADGLEQALAMPAANREAARRHAAGFTWRACAENTYAAYLKAVRLKLS